MKNTMIAIAPEHHQWRLLSNFYPILDDNSIINKQYGFKDFKNKVVANRARKIQMKLARFDLAPKVLGQLTKIDIALISKQSYDCKDTTNWGYLTETALLGTKPSMKHIQQLVDNIEEKTKLKFWDCHYDNVGHIKRDGINKLVCIDTGYESFMISGNAWGYASPGPKCSDCLRFHHSQSLCQCC